MAEAEVLAPCFFGAFYQVVPKPDGACFPQIFADAQRKISGDLRFFSAKICGKTCREGLCSCIEYPIRVDSNLGCLTERFLKLDFAVGK